MQFTFATCAFFFDFLHEITLKTSKFSPPAGSKISLHTIYFAAKREIHTYTHTQKINRVMNEKPDLHPAMQCQKGGEPRFESLTPRGTFLDETLRSSIHTRTNVIAALVFHDF